MDVMKAVEDMLSRLDSVQLASVTEAGYPLAREMELRTRDGLREFCFFTKRTSNKARQFTTNPKAGVSFCVGDDCVSLVGEVEITEGAERPDFCKLVFTSVEGTAFIDGQFLPIAFPQSRRQKALCLPTVVEPPKRYACPCCGYYTFPAPKEEAIAYICPVCFWENDVFDPEPDAPSDENGGMALLEGWENYKKWGAVQENFIRHIRKPLPEEYPENQ